MNKNKGEITGKKRRAKGFVFVIFFLSVTLFSRGIFRAESLKASENKSEKDEIEQEERVEKKLKKKKKKYVKPMETLVIGDSIGYGMSLIGHPTGVDDADKVYWITEGGAGIGLISDNLKIKLGHSIPNAINNTLTKSRSIDLVTEIKKKNIKNVVILLGMNWIGAKSAYHSAVRMKAIREKTGSNVFYFSTLPIVDRKAAKYGYRLRNADVVEYNRMVKDGIEDTGVVFVNTYKAVKKIKGYQNATGDGLHYGRSVYNEAFKHLLKIIEKKNKEDFEKIEKWRRKGRGIEPFAEMVQLDLKTDNGEEP